MNANVNYKTMLGAALGVVMTSGAMAAGEGWTTDLAAAKKEAIASKRDIFMNFTGSDW